MQEKEIKNIKFFTYKKDEEKDEDLRIFMVTKVMPKRKMVIAERYYELGGEEISFPFLDFLNDEIEIFDPNIIYEREEESERLLEMARKQMREKKKKEDELKDAHFHLYLSPFKRGQEIRLNEGYPKGALDFSTAEDRFYLDDCKIDEDGNLLYSLMTKGTRKNRENTTYTFYTDYAFLEKHFTIIKGSFYLEKKEEIQSGIDWK